MVDLGCSLSLVAAALLVAVAYARRVSRVGAAQDARIDRAGSSFLLSKEVMQLGYWAMRPLARACIAAGASANAVSWMSLALAAGAGVSVALGHFGVGALLSVVSSMCDSLDGMVARETGSASDAGEVLDAAVDRYAELLLLGGIAVYQRDEPFALVLTLAATAGSVMVSYSTAKAEALRVRAPRGWMRREERAAYLALGIALVPFSAAAGALCAAPRWIERVPLLVVLSLVAVVGNVSAVLRLRAVAQAARQPVGVRPTEALARDGHAAASNALR